MRIDREWLLISMRAQYWEIFCLDPRIDPAVAQEILAGRLEDNWLRNYLKHEDGSLGWLGSPEDISAMIHAFPERNAPAETATAPQNARSTDAARRKQSEERSSEIHGILALQAYIKAVVAFEERFSIAFAPTVLEEIRSEAETQYWSIVDEGCTPEVALRRSRRHVNGLFCLRCGVAIQVDGNFQPIGMRPVVQRR